MSDYHQFLIANGYEPDAQMDDGTMIFSAMLRARLPAEHQMASFLAGRAADFIDRNSGDPFMLYVSTFEPHPPYHGPYDDMYDPESLPVGPTFLQVPEDSSRHNTVRAEYCTQYLGQPDAETDSVPANQRRARSRRDFRSRMARTPRPLLRQHYAGGRDGGYDTGRAGTQRRIREHDGRLHKRTRRDGGRSRDAGKALDVRRIRPRAVADARPMAVVRAYDGRRRGRTRRPRSHHTRSYGRGVAVSTFKASPCCPSCAARRGTLDGNDVFIQWNGVSDIDDRQPRQPGDKSAKHPALAHDSPRRLEARPLRHRPLRTLRHGERPLRAKQPNRRPRPAQPRPRPSRPHPPMAAQKRRRRAAAGGVKRTRPTLVGRIPVGAIPCGCALPSHWARALRICAAY